MKNLFLVVLMSVAGCVGSDKAGVDVGSAEVVSSSAPVADSAVVPAASASASLEPVESAAPVATSTAAPASSSAPAASSK